MLIVNIYSRYIWIFFLKAKDELARTFISFRHIIERNFDTNIRSVQSNGGKVFQFLSYTLHSIGINHQKICPYTFEHNSVMEIRTKRVVERGFIVLIHSRLDIKCQLYDFHTTVHVLNRLPSNALQNGIIYQLLYHRKPDFVFLKTFGCLSFP